MKKLYDGITILDFTNNIAGPNCAAYFADFGANVVKIERPVFGDDTRFMAPMVEGSSMVYWYPNRGKKSVTIDLNDPRGIEMIKEMIPKADVIIESFRPGVMKKFGLDYESVRALNPGLVYCSISAFGQTGANAKKPGYDLIAQARSGLIDYNGYPDMPPLKITFVIGDYVGGLYGAIGIAQGLLHKERTGEGQHIDISLVDGLITFNNNVEIYSALGRELKRAGNHFGQLCPYGLFNGKDGQSMVICTANQKQWLALINAMGRPELQDDPDLKSIPDRVAHLDKVVEIIESWLVTFDDIQDAVDILENAGLAVSKVFSGKDLVNNPDLIERGAVVDFPPPTGVKSITNMKGRGNPIKMSETPPVISQPPALGEHNDEVFASFGFDKGYVDQLQAEWKQKYSK